MEKILWADLVFYLSEQGFYCSTHNGCAVIVHRRSGTHFHHSNLAIELSLQAAKDILVQCGEVEAVDYGHYMLFMKLARYPNHYLNH